jgi:hypothetical protein
MYQEKLEWMLKDLAAPMEVLSAQFAAIQLKQDELLSSTNFPPADCKYLFKLTQISRIPANGEDRPTSQNL